ncbi:hypothetical protein CT694_36065 (plasmid) [Bacillus wiedmannii bv. thuringiensis]|nr:hypothetical protein CT694_36065 [Bacillus wiedmannii bv. thuringiensis]
MFSSIFGQFSVLPGAITIPPDSILPFTESNIDNTIGFNLSGGQITVQNSGVYAMDFRITLASANAGVFVTRINGVNIFNTAFATTGAGGTAPSAITTTSTTFFRLNANDIVDIFRLNGTSDISTTGSIDGTNFSTIQLRLIKLMD